MGAVCLVIPTLMLVVNDSRTCTVQYSTVQYSNKTCITSNLVPQIVGKMWTRCAALIVVKIFLIKQTAVPLIAWPSSEQDGTISVTLAVTISIAFL